MNKSRLSDRSCGRHAFNGAGDKPGTRYVFDALSSERTDTVIFVGQVERYVTVPWSALGK